MLGVEHWTQTLQQKRHLNLPETDLYREANCVTVADYQGYERHAVDLQTSIAQLTSSNANCSWSASGAETAPRSSEAELA